MFSLECLYFRLSLPLHLVYPFQVACCTLNYAVAAAAAAAAALYAAASKGRYRGLERGD